MSLNDSALAGAASGFIGRGIVQPLDVIKIRLQLQVEPIKKNHGKYTGIIQATRCIYNEEGIRGLWKGHLTGQIHAVSFSIVQFWLFSFLKKFDTFQIKNKFASGSHMANMICGSLSGMGGIIATHPLDVLRTRLVAQGEPRIYKGSFVNAAGCIIRQEGVTALYKGLLPNVMLISPQTGLQFFFYGLCQRTIDNIRMFLTDKDLTFVNSGYLQSGFSGGMAGILAKTAVYPLDLVKKRMQVQGFEVAREKFGRVHKSQGFIRCLQTIYCNEGLGGYTKGLRAALIKAFLSIGLKFSVFEYVLTLIRA